MSAKKQALGKTTERGNSIGSLKKKGAGIQKGVDCPSDIPASSNMSRNNLETSMALSERTQQYLPILNSRSWYHPVFWTNRQLGLVSQARLTKNTLQRSYQDVIGALKTLARYRFPEDRWNWQATQSWLNLAVCLR